MKRIGWCCLMVSLLASLFGCGGEMDGPSMYVEPARLTEEEERVAALLGLNTEHHIFDFVLDDRVRSLQIYTYELLDGEWEQVLGGGGQAFCDTEGRLALGFGRIADGVRVAVQGETTGGAVSYTPEAKADLDGIGCATSCLKGRTEMIYEQEIPLVVQIITADGQVRSGLLEAFESPGEYAEYEAAYAITVRFSTQTVPELPSDD